LPSACIMSDAHPCRCEGQRQRWLGRSSDDGELPLNGMAQDGGHQNVQTTSRRMPPDFRSPVCVGGGSTGGTETAPCTVQAAQEEASFLRSTASPARALQRMCATDADHLLRYGSVDGRVPIPRDDESNKGRCTLHGLGLDTVPSPGFIEILRQAAPTGVVAGRGPALAGRWTPPNIAIHLAPSAVRNFMVTVRRARAAPRQKFRAYHTVHSLVPRIRFPPFEVEPGRSHPSFSAL
jgi:hypothetical protein